jgi:hypothetical protein
MTNSGCIRPLLQRSRGAMLIAGTFRCSRNGEGQFLGVIRCNDAEDVEDLEDLEEHTINKFHVFSER